MIRNMIHNIIRQLTYNPPATLHMLFTFLFFVFAILTVSTETNLWNLFASLTAVCFFLTTYFYLKEY